MKENPQFHSSTPMIYSPPVLRRLRLSNEILKRVGQRGASREGEELVARCPRCQFLGVFLRKKTTKGQDDEQKDLTKNLG